MTVQFQAYMLLGALVLLAIIFVFLKKGLMTVKYSLLWLGLSIVLVIFAACPYVVFVLSLSIAITQLADKCKRLTQENALLEKRVRELERRLPPEDRRGE